MRATPLKLLSTPRAEPTAIGDALHEVRRKFHARAVAGPYARRRWAAMLATQVVFYGLPWLNWNGHQAVLLDVAARKSYFFALMLGPEDVIGAAILLALSTLALLLFSAFTGRMWCGHACPQTVHTELFLWVERKCEGDRVARIRLDAAPWSAGKLARRFAKHVGWGSIAILTGCTMVGYFSPIRPLVAGLESLSIGVWESFWIVSCAVAAYVSAGWMRERVCKHLCPYPRLQNATSNGDTMRIVYDSARGEPRRTQNRSGSPGAAAPGDCVDCSICVHVCPTGIDIRNGPQRECIGCTACIDGCNAVMDKLGYAPGLIRYDTSNGLPGHLASRDNGPGVAAGRRARGR